MKTIFPGDSPVVLLATRMPPLNPILDTPGNIFDDKMAVVNASMRGGIRGTQIPCCSTSRGSRTIFTTTRWPA